MDATDSGRLLASKWDLPFVLFGTLRVAFGDLPLWVRLVVCGLVGSLGVWTAVTWLRERRRRAT
ncbi:hypothetical protein ACIPRL_26085 [Streptomyces sp. NPDC090085]|uniref:hypothetical protein n=1 Tax=unclassified Streptomyces TaxID=2593676 RepID=UPI0033CD9A3B